MYYKRCVILTIINLQQLICAKKNINEYFVTNKSKARDIVDLLSLKLLFLLSKENKNGINKVFYQGKYPVLLPEI